MRSADYLPERTAADVWLKGSCWQVPRQRDHLLVQRVAAEAAGNVVQGFRYVTWRLRAAVVGPSGVDERFRYAIDGA